MRVIVVGGGIGGLALANGLVRGGHDAVVVERDRDLRATPGYHITLRRAAQQALAELLPQRDVERLRASASDGAMRGADALFDDQGAERGALDVDPDVGIDVDRVTLRLLLAEPVAHVLLRGRVGVAATATREAASVALDDGTVLHGDLVVAADGVGSPIATTLAGAPTSAPTGLVGVSGRTLAAALDDAERERLGTRSSLAIGADATALYVGHHDPIGHAVVDDASLRMSETREETYIWGAMLAEDGRGAVLRGLRGAALRDATVGALRDAGWGEAPLQALLATDAEGVAAFRFHAASADASALAPWPGGRVTAIGDAVHATPPTAGMGAGVAIEDAADLVRALSAADAADDVALAAALEGVHARMRERGAAAVGRAMVGVGMILGTRSAART
ncbi:MULTISPECIES: FAD-dependent oxidoreductase [unclassified Agrococcus]|uniref:FAD-dependent oxidoreductase n=1 Tax=unclassified Agrococcus TaxID=2615065 RepID=UPI00361E6EB8